MTYPGLLRQLARRGIFRIQPDLGRVRRVLDHLGNPQNRIPSIHVAGTNGKGSVCAAMESILRHARYRTALYTSPHLADIRERIRIGGRPVSRTAFRRAGEAVLAAEKSCGVKLTYFEFNTAMAFVAHEQARAQIAVIECGLGGLWDATNTMREPLASIITTIGLDHTQWLGKTEAQIARQKAGILRPRSLAVSGVRGPGRRVIERQCRKLKTTLLEIDRDFTAQAFKTRWEDAREVIRYNSETFTFGLLGAHQAANAGIIIATARALRHRGLTISEQAIREGMKTVSWPGRLQIVRRPRGIRLIFDGAHNPQATQALTTALRDSPFHNAFRSVVFSAYKDKDFPSMARLLAPDADRVYLCALPPPRGASLAALRQAFSSFHGPVSVISNPKRALAQAVARSPAQGVVLVTGSLALVGELLPHSR